MKSVQDREQSPRAVSVYKKYQLSGFNDVKIACLDESRSRFQERGSVLHLSESNE
jgi:hypothetical protein